MSLSLGMMTLLIFLYECVRMVRLCVEVTGMGDSKLEEFFSRATPEQVWKMICHANMSIFMLQLSTIIFLFGGHR